MDLKHIIPQQRRRTYGPSFDIAFSTDKSNESRVGPNPVHSRASSGTFVNENRRIVGKTTSTTSLNPASVPVGGVAVFAVPPGSVVGWLNNSVVVVMEDTDGNDQIGAERHVTGTLIHKTDTAITLLVTSKSGTTTLSSWFVSYRGLRNDHDPVTGLCRGALLEESRTNLLLRSDNFGTTWQAVQLNTTGTPPYLNVGIAPDGTTTADKLIANTTASTHQLRQDVAVAAAATYTFSCFYKAQENSFACLAIAGATTIVPQVDNYAFFNLTNGNVSAALVGFSSASSTSFGNGWYRFQATITTIAAGTISIRVSGANSVGNSTFYSGNNTDGFLVWGAQFEAGSSATSYIPTTATSTVRSADVYGITGTDFSRFYNQTEGTLFISSRRTIPTGLIYTTLVSANDGTNNNRVFIGNEGNPNDIGFSIIRSGVTEYGGNLTNGTLIRRAALAYRSDSTNRAYNGNIGTVDTSVLTPTVNQFGFGVHQIISSARYFRTRLSDAQIQALTTLVSEPIVYNGVAIWYNGEGIIETN